ncbi:MAG: PadR family transcriptional regulator [Candidatus Bathyarchaeia archaeon]
MFPFKHWMRHMAMVPKGFLRYHVLKLLSIKPMSGSEIMNEIEQQTNGHWKPSPGSIYPLLAWLQDKGYIKEAGEKEAGVKRYTLTAEGKAFLEEHEKRREELRKRFKHFGPRLGFMGPMWFEFHPERARELRKAIKNLAIAILDFREKLRCQYSEKAVEEARKVLEEATKKIEEITDKNWSE